MKPERAFQSRCATSGASTPVYGRTPRMQNGWNAGRGGEEGSRGSQEGRAMLREDDFVL